MSDGVSFIEMHYPLQLKRERALLLEVLLDFAIQGAVVDGGEAARLLVHEARAEFKAQLFDRMVENLPAGTLSVPAGDTADLLVKALTEAMTVCSVDSITLPCLPGRWADEIGSQVPLQQLDYMADGYPPSVLGAYHCANDNMLVCESRLVCLEVFTNLLRSNHRHDALSSCFSELRSMLYKRRERFMLDVLLFGALTGKAAEAAELVTRRVLHRPGDLNFAIMQYLERDGRFPGHWSTSTEDKFRADIVRRFNALSSPEVPRDSRAVRVKVS